MRRALAPINSAIWIGIDQKNSWARLVPQGVGEILHISRVYGETLHNIRDVGTGHQEARTSAKG